MRALDSIRKDTVLLRNEIIRLTMGGWTLDLYVFMTCDGDMNDYSRDEAMEYLAKGSYIPGWFVIDEGFYGLQLPTLISIAEALKCN